MTGDLVAVWKIPLSDQVHTVEFEHGTTTGKRVIRINGQEILRKEWMFALIGTETFELGPAGVRCVISISPASGFMYEYSLMVNGKRLEAFMEAQSKVMRTWAAEVSGEPVRVVLGEWTLPYAMDRSNTVSAAEKDTLDIWVNGQKVEAAWVSEVEERFCGRIRQSVYSVVVQGEFVEDGTETHFSVLGVPAFIRAVSSGTKRQGIVYSLVVNGELIPPDTAS
ncbi:FAIM, partial [Cordylochernes scorpioides]